MYHGETEWLQAELKICGHKMLLHNKKKENELAFIRTDLKDNYIKYVETNWRT
jgi:hypothetical protein